MYVCMYSIYILCAQSHYKQLFGMNKIQSDKTRSKGHSGKTTYFNHISVHQIHTFAPIHLYLIYIDNLVSSFYSAQMSRFVYIYIWLCPGDFHLGLGHNSNLCAGVCIFEDQIKNGHFYPSTILINQTLHIIRLTHTIVYIYTYLHKKPMRVVEKWVMYLGTGNIETLHCLK